MLIRLLLCSFLIMAPILRGGRGRGNRSRGLPPLGQFTRSSTQSTILGSFRMVHSSRPVTRSVGFVDPSASTFAPTAPPSHVSHTTSASHDLVTAPSTRVPSESCPHTQSIDSAATTVGHTQLHTTLRPFTRSVASVRPSSATSARTRQTFPRPASSSDGQSTLHLGSICIYNINFVSLF